MNGTSGVREGEETDNALFYKNETAQLKRDVELLNADTIALKNVAEEKAREAGKSKEDADLAKAGSESARDASVIAEEGSVSARRVSESNAVLSRSFAKGDTASRDSEETDNAEYFKIVASQALEDLLRMLGNSIATLDENGKLTPSQIPNLSINNVEIVTNVENMLLLTEAEIQYGDAVLIKPETVITDSYLFTGTDRTDITHYSKLGVSYVANAGHAINADEATNAGTVNNIRFIRMTQSQYDVAVKDTTGTLYVVRPDPIV